jgi:hypothetical protein
MRAHGFTPQSMSTPALTTIVAAAALLGIGAAADAATNNIMITGYWPPTNEMIRPFSTNASQNPGGWQGGNWEGRGYNIHSYFPEFPGGTDVNPRGTGDFQVDYQAASADFWRVVNELKPVAIISFSRGSAGASWEIESAHRKLPLASWTPDYLAPTRPTADLPIAQEPDNTRRQSSLPMNNILTAVSNLGLPMTTFIDTSTAYGGTFVSEFTGYHSAWYAALHASPNDPFRCVAGGHIHVGINTATADAVLATRTTLRELTAYVDTMVPSPGAMAIIPALTLFGLRRRRSS